MFNKFLENEQDTNAEKKQISRKPVVNSVNKRDYLNKNDIAIIGIGCRLPQADNYREFWKHIRAGKDFIREFPLSRKKDTDILLPGLARSGKEARYYPGGFLDSIDTFDHSFFNISFNEAAYMDPHQRVFLETAWSAFEDAGYNRDQLDGSNTGVFLGFSSDFDIDYKTYIQLINPDLLDNLSVSGNIKSIIASRISYILNLNGPSAVIDTACSSCLVAVHLACQALRSRECDKALVGGVKLRILPVEVDSNDELGLRSIDGKCKTFDDTSDGIGSGEGACALVLKPLAAAVRDNDNIHAVIRGSAYNQDGSSIGITAPNSNAQEELIIRTWQNSDIAPETISYIEAHGTGTKLGDPIEIRGIEKAFRRCTDKQQFCAIGSVKTNLGHLDHAAGMAGLLKVVLALKNKELPPSLHFKVPNKEIDFEQSPVYVNDMLTPWEPSGEKRRAAVSAFGLSGTNCHVVLEEYNTVVDADRKHSGSHVFVLSARTSEQLHELVRNYLAALEQNTCRIEDICFTVSAGRNHYTCRLACIVDTPDALKQKLRMFLAGSLREKGGYTGQFSIVQNTKKVRDKSELTESDVERLSCEAEEVVKNSGPGDEQINFFKKICVLYCEGASVNWHDLYKDTKVRRISLPVYPFEKKRCWIDPDLLSVDTGRGRVEGRTGHPLVDYCAVESFDSFIFSTTLSVEKHWILNEHKIGSQYIVPGTAYIEMIYSIMNSYFPDGFIECNDIVFLNPVSVGEGRPREIQIILRQVDDHFTFTIASKDGAHWEVHAEGSVREFYENDVPVMHSIDKIINDQGFRRVEESEINQKNIIEIGPRWDSLRNAYRKDNIIFAEFKLSDIFAGDLQHYLLHPALLDHCVNIGNGIVGSDTYLPFSYKSLQVFGRLPREFFAQVTLKNNSELNPETGKFDIDLLDQQGRVLVRVRDYIIKKINPESFSGPAIKKSENSCYLVDWIESVSGRERTTVKNKNIVVFSGEGSEAADMVVETLRKNNNRVIVVQSGNTYENPDPCLFTIENTREDYDKLLDELKNSSISHFVHMEGCVDYAEVERSGECNSIHHRVMHGLFAFVKSFLNNKAVNKADIYIVANCIYDITGEEECLNPLGAALFGLGKVVAQENESINVACIDIGSSDNAVDVAEELAGNTSMGTIAYRGPHKYIPEINSLDLPERKTDAVDIKDGGVYIITGGTGSLALETAKYLADKQNVTICLVSRTQLPPLEQWDKPYPEGGPKIARTIETLRYIKNAGSVADYYSGDISVEKDVASIIKAVGDRYGDISGVFHTAGLAGDGFLFRKEEQTFFNVLKPKMDGTLNLHKYTQPFELDFFIMFSSVTSVFGGMGQSDYTAANAFMDGFAAYRKRNGKPAIAINWPAWSQVGMAVDNASVIDGPIDGLATSDGIGFLDIIISHYSGSSLLVGALRDGFNFHDLEGHSFAFNRALVSSAIRKNMRKPQSGTPGKPVDKIILNGAADNQYSDIEITMAGIWARVLGFTEVDIYENFANLGGDSVQAVRLLKELEAEFGDMVDITDVFTYPSISELSGYINKKSETADETEIKQPLDQQKSEDTAAEDDGIDEVLEQLINGDLSVAEAEKII